MAEGGRIEAGTIRHQSRDWPDGNDITGRANIAAYPARTYYCPACRVRASWPGAHRPRCPHNKQGGAA